MSRLDAVKEGDAVAIHEPCGWSLHSVTRRVVGRCTATLVYIDGQAFLRRTGRVKGESSYSQHGKWAEPWDDATHPAKIAAFVAARKLSLVRRKLQDYRWHEIQQPLADAVLALITPVADPSLPSPQSPTAEVAGRTNESTPAE